MKNRTNVSRVSTSYALSAINMLRKEQLQTWFTLSVVYTEIFCLLAVHQESSAQTVHLMALPFPWFMAVFVCRQDILCKTNGLCLISTTRSEISHSLE